MSPRLGHPTGEPGTKGWITSLKFKNSYFFAEKMVATPSADVRSLPERLALHSHLTACAVKARLLLHCNWNRIPAVEDPLPLREINFGAVTIPQEFYCGTC